MTDDAKAIFDIEKKKKRVPKGQPEPQFDPSVVESPRLPDDLLVEVFKWRLG